MPRIVAALFLLWGLVPNPYGYYILLRFVVCGVCSYTAFRYALDRRSGSAWLFGVLGVVYNPLFPVYLTREIWLIMDLVTAILLLWSLYRDRSKVRSAA